MNHLWTINDVASDVKIDDAFSLPRSLPSVWREKLSVRGIN